jgi:dihydrofolate synthase/folylpolyglutamate synthase
MLDIFRNDMPYLQELKSPLAGFYQRKNIPTVLGVCELLGSRGINLGEHIIREGIEKVVVNTGLAGRWQILGREPLTICDTGHNEAGLREVMAQIHETPHEKLHFVFGMVNDKKLEPVLALLPRDAVYYFCKPDIPRGLEVELLHQAAIQAGLTGTCHKSVADALKAARKAAGAKDLVFVGGSTFVVAEVV